MCVAYPIFGEDNLANGQFFGTFYVVFFCGALSVFVAHNSQWATQLPTLNATSVLALV